MLLGPHETARRLEDRHQPGWSVWYGTQTRQYWAVACWVRAAGAMFGASSPPPSPRESAAHYWDRAIRIVRAGQRPPVGVSGRWR